MTDVLTLASSIAAGLVAGFVYGVLWYARARQKTGEPLRPAKLAGTLVVSACIGASFGLSGMAVTEANVIAMLAANTAVIALLEPILKSFFQEVGWFPEYYD